MDELPTVGLGAARDAHTQAKVSRFAASDLDSLVKFLVCRILEAHRRSCRLFRGNGRTNGSSMLHQLPQPVEVNETSEKEMQAPHPWRVLVGIGGIPGSGKSTMAGRLQAALNGVSKSQFCQCLLPVEPETDVHTSQQELKQENMARSPVAVAVVGMDGFHLTRAQLDEFPDPKEAHRRRGAPWTFDLRAFWEALQTLKMKAEPVVFPTFDHAAKDPDSRGCVVATSTRVVLVEGLYITATEEGLSHPGTFDVTVFIDTPKTIAEDRVIQRHVASGISRDREEAKQRYCPTRIVSEESEPFFPTFGAKPDPLALLPIEPP
ncbi:DEHA2C11396p, related [Eimeria mitis]|uniref:DEHA2C11396p, related n=1 Tax=Eimeria mitis TaxID=44415 RepID=U6KDY7_9EIME|nr:DEHA2C11396p, related [Eimeria mitis]CDJ36164.1 DEHA2C11396p, related [Eimeria mitis]